MSNMWVVPRSLARKSRGGRSAPVLAAAGILLAVILLAGSCGSTDRSAPTRTIEQALESDRSDGDFALSEGGEVTLEASGFPPATVTREEITDGGPAPDGIPPIDDPKFLDVGDVSFLEPNEPVVSFIHDGEERAYPIQIMMWHEIVNDTVGDTPVAVTFCPLCNSAFVFDRRVEGEVVSFGTSGKLWRSSLVMYDRQTRSLWSHFSGEGIAGVRAGYELETLPVAITSWQQFSESHPDGLVLSTDTGVDRPYGENPYPGYDDVAVPPFAFTEEVDPRAAAKERVVGVELESGGSAAIALERLMAERAVPFELGDSSMIALWVSGTASALEGADVAGGRDVGTTAVFELADDESVVFNRQADRFESPDGTVWRVDGLGIGGPRAGEQLSTVVHVDTFWFAWASFQPTTTLLD